MEVLFDLKNKIEEKLKKNGYDDFEIELNKSGKNIELKIKKMYNRISLDFKDLLFLSDLFQTTDISSSDYTYDGCDTCDALLEYGTDFVIKNIGIEIE